MKTPTESERTQNDSAWGMIAFTRPVQFDLLGSYHVYMNRDFIGQIDKRQQWTLALPAEKHEFVVRAGWYSSPPFQIDLKAGWVHHIEIGSNLRGWKLALLLPCIAFCPSRCLYLSPLRRERYDETIHWAGISALGK